MFAISGEISSLPDVDFGDLKFLKWAKENGCKKSYKFIALGCFFKSMEILIWARDQNVSMDRVWAGMALRVAIGKQNLEMVQWSIGNDYPWSTVNYAAKSGSSIEIFQFVFSLVKKPAELSFNYLL